MKKIISFVLWGDQRLYNDGAIENVKEAAIFYPGWTCRFYCDTKATAFEKLKTLDCEVVPMNFENDSWTNLFVRYKPATEDDVEVSIFRDTDSRVNPREAGAVKEWLESDKALHYMKDDEVHYRIPIHSGMWGIKKGNLNNFYELSDKWLSDRGITYVKNKKAAVDEWFLGEVVWPMFKHDCMGHCGAGYCRMFEPVLKSYERPFPKTEEMKWGHYVGCSIPILGERKKVPVFRLKK